MARINHLTTGEPQKKKTLFPTTRLKDCLNTLFHGKWKIITLFNPVAASPGTAIPPIPASPGTASHSIPVSPSPGTASKQYPSPPGQLHNNLVYIWYPGWLGSHRPSVPEAAIHIIPLKTIHCSAKKKKTPPGSKETL